MGLTVTSISVHLDNGETVEMSFDLDYGWQQWGARTETLGVTMAIPEALVKEAQEEPEFKDLIFGSDEEE